MKDGTLQLADGIEGTIRRWSRYRLINRAITAANGAKLLKEDPWQEFRKPVGRGRTLERPYVTLLELHRQLEKLHKSGESSSGSLKVREKHDRLILDWCNRNGLLGLVP